MSMDDRDGSIWMDGQCVPWREAKIHVLTHSLHYGLAAFEGIRAYETPKGVAIFRLKEHLDRLYNSAHIYQMPIPFEQSVLHEATKEVVKKNQVKNGYIRPIVFFGAEKMGLSTRGANVHVVIAAWEWGAYLGAEGLSKGIRVKTSSFARHHVNVTLPRAKISSTYANSILASNEAIGDGYDEALLLDVDGFVAEGPGENLFLIKEGTLYEPELTSALCGITRSTVIELATSMGIEVKSQRLTRDDVYVADEAFFTGSAAEITPIRELDRRVIGNGGMGPITQKIQQMYFDCVKGKQASHAHWLTLV